jgi:PEP-CTERM motif
VTTAGDIYRFNSSGTPIFVASIGTDSEGMDIASADFGPFAGDLLVASEGTELIHAVSPGGTVTTLLLNGGTPVQVSEAETISTVPINLGMSGSGLEGFYVASYPNNILFAGAANFAGLQGDAIVTEEESSDSQVFDLHYDGDGMSNAFTLTQFTQDGTQLNQSEDGIFVTATRLKEIGVPEPSSLPVLLAGLGLMGGAFYFGRKRAKAT